MKISNVVKIIIVVAIIIAVAGISMYFINQNNKKYLVEQVSKYNYYKLQKEGKVGIINLKGEILIEPVYDDIKIPNPEKPVFVCKNAEQFTVLNEKAEEILTQYQEVDAIELNGIVSNMPYEKSVLKYKQDGKYGLVNLKGKKITAPVYEEITSLAHKEGELLVKQDGKYGVINQKGTTILENKYDSIVGDGFYTEDDQYALSGYIVSVTTKEGYRYGYINHKQKQILKPEYASVIRLLQIEQTNDIYLAVVKNGQVGILKNGKEIVEYKYQDIEYNTDNQTFTLERNSKLGVCNLEGKIIVPVEYDGIVIAGLYIQATKNDETQIFDLEGKQVEDVVFNGIHTTANDNYYITVDKSEKYGIMKKNKDILVDNQYSYIEYLQEDFFVAVKEDGKIGMINAQGTTIVDFNYDVIQKLEGSNVIEAKILEQNITDLYAKDLSKIVSVTNGNISIKNGYIHVIDNKMQYIDLNGSKVSDVTALRENEIFAKEQNGKWGFIDKQGKTVVEFEYDEVTQINEYGFAGIKKDGKWGVINSEGKEIQTPKYEIEDKLKPEFLGKYYRVYYGYGESYYTDDTNS